MYFEVKWFSKCILLLLYIVPRKFLLPVIFRVITKRIILRSIFTKNLGLVPSEDIVLRDIKILRLVQVKTSIKLKIVNTFGNCQRPVFPLGVSHMHKITNL